MFLTLNLVWTFHSRTLNNKINRLYEKALQPFYRNNTRLSFEDLLQEVEKVNTHQRHLQILATKIYNVKIDLAPDIMQYIFHFAEKPYELRNNSTLKRRCN